MLKIDDLNAYTRFPDRLISMKPELSKLEKPDVFGVKDRLLAVRANWPGVPGGRAIDLGGNSGYFSLSLIDEGLISQSTVYDTNIRVLEAGEQMASMMGLSKKVRFVEQAVSLNWLRGVDPVDTVIDLNLIHHAGTLYDIDEVREQGFEAYARAWLSQIRRISKFCAFGLGYKETKPRNWDVQNKDRPVAIIDISASAGWKVLYEANVQDIADFGVERANGLWSILPSKYHRRKGALWTKASSLFSSKVGKGRQHGAGESRSKRGSYHLLLLH